MNFVVIGFSVFVLSIFLIGGCIALMRFKPNTPSFLTAFLFIGGVLASTIGFWEGYIALCYYKPFQAIILGVIMFGVLGISFFLAIRQSLLQKVSFHVTN